MIRRLLASRRGLTAGIESDAPSQADVGPKDGEFAGRWGVPRLENLAPGLALAGGIAIGAAALTRYEAAVPTVVVGLVIGVAARNLLPLGDRLAPGLNLITRYGLRLAIVLLGTQVTPASLLALGGKTVIIICGLVICALVLGLLAARILELQPPIGLLIGAGTAICGVTAILTLAPLVRARKEETAYAVGTIFTFNIIALLLYPVIGHNLHLHQVGFGTWAGTAVNDTSVVVATGYVYGPTAGIVATLVKLARTTLLLPLVLGVAYTNAPRDAGRSSFNAVRRALPLFIVLFAAISLCEGLGVVPHQLNRAALPVTSSLIILVLVAVGLGTNLRALIELGHKPLVLGVLLGSAMGVLSLLTLYGAGILGQ